MKPGIHPDYRELVSLEISSASHPFFTGTQRLIDAAGRVERFRRKYAEAPNGPRAMGATKPR